MARPKSYRDLIVWQKAMGLARTVLALTELPRRAGYGLEDQMRRAAISVLSNIAEGYGRLTDSQFRHFLGVARGSLCELQTQTKLAVDLGYVDTKKGSEVLEHSSEVGRILNGLLRSLQSTSRTTNRPISAISANSANSPEG